MLFTGAKISHLNGLPQGKAEKDRRSLAMAVKMDEAGFGNCRNYGECSAVCPKEIPLDVIADNRDYGLLCEKRPRRLALKVKLLSVVGLFWPVMW